MSYLDSSGPFVTWWSDNKEITMSKISDERLAELIANAAGATEGAWWLDDVADALTELQSLRSQPAGVRVKGLGDLLDEFASDVESLAMLEHRAGSAPSTEQVERAKTDIVETRQRILSAALA